MPLQDSGRGHRRQRRVSRDLEKALALADYEGFPARRDRAAAAGLRRGIGISCFLEHAGGVPTESAAVRFPRSDKALVALGVQGTGQGHGTVFARLAAKHLASRPISSRCSRGIRGSR